MKKDSKIYLAGHTGLVGSALMRNLKKKGYHNIVTRLYPDLILWISARSMHFLKRRSLNMCYWQQQKLVELLQTIFTGDNSSTKI